MSDAGDNAVTNEAKELVALCRAGRLYDIDKTLAAGKTLDISAATKRGRQRSLLEIAVETGFHSLVELIAKFESSQSSRNTALREAVSCRRLDLVELLLVNGADIKAVPLSDVLLAWEPKMIRYFLDHGADTVEGRPFAEAFGAKVRTALRAFVEYRRVHPELATTLQEQLDCSLRHFCCEGNLKWVSLLIWAGADARSRGPSLGKQYTEDPECYTSGLEEACHSENLDVMKKLKPDPSRDNLSELLHCAAISSRKAVLEYLLKIGANPNDKPNGGSTALETALWHLSFVRFDPYGSHRLKSKYDVSKDVDCVRELLAHGATWNPDDTYHVTSLRRTLLDCEPGVTIELLELFRKHNACPAERVHRLLGTPRIRDHLKPASGALLRLGIHLEAGPRLRHKRTTSRR
jgi:ankyrin repeat protein